MNVEVNYLAILLAGVASMIIGFLWYSPILFAKPWMKLMGLTKESIEETKNKMMKLYAVSFVLALVTAYVLSHVMTLSLSFFGYSPVMTGITTAFFMWVGFIMPVQLTDVLFGGKKFKLFAINTGYQLVTLLAMGVLIGLL